MHKVIFRTKAMIPGAMDYPREEPKQGCSSTLFSCWAELSVPEFSQMPSAHLVDLTEVSLYLWMVHCSENVWVFLSRHMNVIVVGRLLIWPPTSPIIVWAWHPHIIEGVYWSFLSVWAGPVTYSDQEKVMEMMFILGVLSLGLKRTGNFYLLPQKPVST